MPREQRTPAGFASGLHTVVLCVLMLAVVGVTVGPTREWFRARVFAIDVVVVLLAFWVVVTQDWPWARIRAFLAHPLHLAIGGFLGWVALSSLWSEVPQYSQFELLRHGTGVLLYFGVVCGLSGGQVGAVAGTLVVSAALAGFQGLVGSTRHRDGWVAGNFVDPQLLAGFLCLALPIAAGLAGGGHHSRTRTAVGAASMLAAVALLGTHNRSAWVGGAVGITAVLLLCLRTGTPRARGGVGWKQMVVPAAAILAAVGMFLVLSQTGGSSLKRAATVTTLQRDDGWVSRMRSWQAARWVAAERPLTGVGIGAFPLQQALYNRYSREQSEILATGPSLSENAHNTYLQLAADLGYPGLALYLGIFVAYFRTVVPTALRSRESSRRWLAAGLVGAIVAQMICAIANPSWEFAECSLFLWVALGLGVAATGQDGRSRELGRA